jgi:hypothetical protein
LGTRCGWQVRARLGSKVHLLVGPSSVRGGIFSVTEKRGVVCQEFGFHRIHTCTHDLAAVTFYADVTACKSKPHSLTHGHVNFAFPANMPDDLEVCCRKAPPHHSCR